MAETIAEASVAEPTSDRHQLIAAIILGVAAVLTAFAAYSSSAAGGDASTLRLDAGRTLDDANFFYGQSNIIKATDERLFLEYATARAEEVDDRVAFLETLMRPELLEAIDWWDDTEDALTPFDEVEDNPYAIDEVVEGDRLLAEADRKVLDSEAADEESSKFDLAAVLLALTLFFAGIATLFRARVVTVTLLTLAGINLGLGIAGLAQGLTA